MRSKRRLSKKQLSFLIAAPIAAVAVGVTSFVVYSSLQKSTPAPAKQKLNSAITQADFEFSGAGPNIQLTFKPSKPLDSHLELRYSTDNKTWASGGPKDLAEGQVFYCKVAVKANFKSTYVVDDLPILVQVNVPAQVLTDTIAPSDFEFSGTAPNIHASLKPSKIIDNHLEIQYSIDDNFWSNISPTTLLNEQKFYARLAVKADESTKYVINDSPIILAAPSIQKQLLQDSIIPSDFEFSGTAPSGHVNLKSTKTLDSHLEVQYSVDNHTWSNTAPATLVNGQVLYARLMVTTNDAKNYAVDETSISLVASNITSNIIKQPPSSAITPADFKFSGTAPNIRVAFQPSIPLDSRLEVHYLIGKTWTKTAPTTLVDGQKIYAQLAVKAGVSSNYMFSNPIVPLTVETRQLLSDAIVPSDFEFSGTAPNISVALKPTKTLDSHLEVQYSTDNHTWSNVSPDRLVSGQTIHARLAVKASDAVNYLSNNAAILLTTPNPLDLVTENEWKKNLQGDWVHVPDASLPAASTQLTLADESNYYYFVNIQKNAMDAIDKIVDKMNHEHYWNWHTVGDAMLDGINVVRYAIYQSALGNDEARNLLAIFVNSTFTDPEYSSKNLPATPSEDNGWTQEGIDYERTALDGLNNWLGTNGQSQSLDVPTIYKNHNDWSAGSYTKDELKRTRPLRLNYDFMKFSEYRTQGIEWNNTFDMHNDAQTQNDIASANGQANSLGYKPPVLQTHDDSGLSENWIYNLRASSQSDPSSINAYARVNIYEGVASAISCFYDGNDLEMATGHRTAMFTPNMQLLGYSATMQLEQQSLSANPMLITNMSQALSYSDVDQKYLDDAKVKYAWVKKVFSISDELLNLLILNALPQNNCDMLFFIMQDFVVYELKSLWNLYGIDYSSDVPLQNMIYQADQMASQITNNPNIDSATALHLFIETADHLIKPSFYFNNNQAVWRTDDGKIPSSFGSSFIESLIKNSVPTEKGVVRESGQYDMLGGSTYAIMADPQGAEPTINFLKIMGIIK